VDGTVHCGRGICNRIRCMLEGHIPPPPPTSTKFLIKGTDEISSGILTSETSVCRINYGVRFNSRDVSVPAVRGSETPMSSMSTKSQTIRRS
jgi:hypothetical protein